MILICIYDFNLSHILSLWEFPYESVKNKSVILVFKKYYFILLVKMVVSLCKVQVRAIANAACMIRDQQ